MAKAVALATVFETISSGLKPKKRIHLGLFRTISSISILGNTPGESKSDAHAKATLVGGGGATETALLAPT